MWLHDPAVKWDGKSEQKSQTKFGASSLVKSLISIQVDLVFPLYKNLVPISLGMKSKTFCVALKSYHSLILTSLPRLASCPSSLISVCFQEVLCFVISLLSILTSRIPPRGPSPLPCTSSHFYISTSSELLRLSSNATPYSFFLGGLLHWLQLEQYPACTSVAIFFYSLIALARSTLIYKFTYTDQALLNCIFLKDMQSMHAIF